GGEFRPVDPRQFTISMVGVIVHYFASAPIAEAITGEDPFTPARLAERRKAVLDVIAAALFSRPDVRSGAEQRLFEISASAEKPTGRMGEWEARSSVVSGKQRQKRTTKDTKVSRRTQSKVRARKGK